MDAAAASTTPTPAATPVTPAAPTRRRRWPRRVAMVVAGLVVGLVAAEWMFRIRDHHGFPKLNVYVADRALGVRLRPGARQRFVYPDNPITSVRINRAGYRGPDFAPPGPDDVLVVGDSQVFGLGVEEHEAFAAVLERTLGDGAVGAPPARPAGDPVRRHVLNGGVPTYGPAEYAAVARELIASRQPKTLVFTVNMVNDLFEVTRPNAARHVVRDGWAVRAEVAGDVIDFPGRGWLARNSHLFYALRRAWHRRTDGEAVASEGTWRDLVDIGAQTVAREAAAQAERDQRTVAVRATEAELERRTAELDQAIVRFLGDELTNDERVALRAAHLQPGDTVYDAVPGAEESRSVVVTAGHMRKGAALRAKLRAKLERVMTTARAPDRASVLASVTDLPALQARLDELTVARLQQALETPLAPVIRALKQFCDERGVRLVLLVLPIDVAVSADEWRKYRATPIDMTSVAALNDEVVALGAQLGLSTLDATAALRAVEPGAFLDHDIHMTPRGHAAVAAALARTLASTPPAPRAGPTVAPVPLPAQWREVPEITVAGSSAARCETKRLRAWLRILCIPDGNADSVPRAITVTRDTSGTAMVAVMPGSGALTVAVGPGDTVTAEFAWARVQRRLDVTWPAGAAAPTAAFTVVAQQPDAPRDYQAAPFASDQARELCRCWQEVYLGERYRGSGEPFCPGVYGAVDDGCAAYATCADRVACALRDPARPPRAPAAAP
ncbi:MAG: hypothetical protein IPL61_31710 [Myxococcales bacterium]|nr:hypothetical protein [Myxococcales bacterium]